MTHCCTRTPSIFRLDFKKYGIKRQKLSTTKIFKYLSSKPPIPQKIYYKYSHNISSIVHRDSEKFFASSVQIRAKIRKKIILINYTIIITNVYYKYTGRSRVYSILSTSIKHHKTYTKKPIFPSGIF